MVGPRRRPEKVRPVTPPYIAGPPRHTRPVAIVTGPLRDATEFRGVVLLAALTGQEDPATPRRPCHAPLAAGPAPRVSGTGVLDLALASPVGVAGVLEEGVADAGLVETGGRLGGTLPFRPFEDTRPPETWALAVRDAPDTPVGPVRLLPTAVGA